MTVDRSNPDWVGLAWSSGAPQILQSRPSLSSTNWYDILPLGPGTSSMLLPASSFQGYFRLRQTSTNELSLPKAATFVTAQTNAAVLSQLNFSNQQDFADAERGLVAPPASNVITNSAGVAVWDLNQYSFLEGEAPATVNPSLWRQARLNMKAGLFKVTDRVYQIRGLDLANMTVVQGDTGWIIIDPLTCIETAAAGLSLANTHLGNRPVKAVIYTHSHVDHFGGVKGVTTQADVDAGRVQVIGPAGFTEHAVSENVFAGNAMSRRSQFMYAPLLPRNVKAQVDAGLGKTTASGTVTLISPTTSITNTGQRLTVDGLEIVFQNVPGSEAPAEIMFYFPQLRALCLSENSTHTLHNLVTLRGAVVRDALAWSRYLNETIELFGSQTDVVFASHHWPTWGRENILSYLKKQRDIYKFLHDQTLHLVNQGYTPLEIAEMIKLPDSLSKEFYNRGYYGTVSHNVKAIYQRYIGWFDGNPAHLHELPPVESSRKYVEFMGGASQVLKKARESFAAGDYRWVAQVVNHVVFADPSNTEARQLQADALEQLGYQAESAPWRNFYLVGASELRNGVPGGGAPSSSSDFVRDMPTGLLFDYFAIRLNADRASGKHFEINWNFTDIKEQYAMTLENSVLNYLENKQFPNANLTLNLTRSGLTSLLLGEKTTAQLIASGDLRMQGNPLILAEFLSLLDKFEFWFNIVTP